MKLLRDFKSIFSPAKKEFNIVDTTMDELPEINFKQIQNREKDGLIIRKFISPENCKLLVEHMKKENPNFDSHQHPIFPSSFAQIDRDSENFRTEMESCFSNSASFVDTFRSVYKFDLLEEISAVFCQLNPGSKHKTPLGFNDKGAYIPGTFRTQHPEKVNINLHCGNQFIQLFPKYYEHLSSTVDVMDQLSYFIMLQEPDAGGRLILYDVTWDEAQDCDTITNSIITLDGRTIPLDISKEIQSSHLEVQAGDLLIFSGGQIWHAVEQVKGNQKRVTFGGFIAFGKGDNINNFHLWS